MSVALLGLGSNIEPEAHLRWVAARLRREFAPVRFSRVYRSPAVGMAGDDFLNACCLLHTDLSLARLIARCKAWEDQRGRDRSAGSWRPRTLDVDVLMFDGQIVDEGLLRYAFAYHPACELVALPQPGPDAACLTEVDLRL